MSSLLPQNTQGSFMQSHLITDYRFTVIIRWDERHNLFHNPEMPILDHPRITTPRSQGDVPITDISTNSVVIKSLFGLHLQIKGR